MDLHERRLRHHPTRRLRATLPIKGRERGVSDTQNSSFLNVAEICKLPSREAVEDQLDRI
jgi:hypothetical protein